MSATPEDGPVRHVLELRCTLVTGVVLSDVMTRSEERASRTLASAIIGARLGREPVDAELLRAYVSEALSLPDHHEPDLDGTTLEQLQWAMNELALLMEWLNKLPIALARLTTAFADIATTSLESLATSRGTSAERELLQILDKLADPRRS